MKNRTKRLSIRTTEEIDKKLDVLKQGGKFRYFSKSDIINLILEDNISRYSGLSVKKLQGRA